MKKVHFSDEELKKKEYRQDISTSVNILDKSTNKEVILKEVIIYKS